MSSKNLIHSIEKYITAIILPKFPEIENFEIKKIFPAGYTFLEIIFFVDGTEQEFEDEIFEYIQDMRNYFGITEFPISTTFHTL